MLLPVGKMARRVPERLPKPRVACREAAPVGRSNAGSPIGPLALFPQSRAVYIRPIAKQASSACNLRSHVSSCTSHLP